MEKIGVFIGKFYPFHMGHAYVIEESFKVLDKLIIVPCWDEGQTIPLEIRVEEVRDFSNKNNFGDFVIIDECLISTKLGTEHKGESRRDLSFIWSKYLIDKYPNMTHFVGSEPYVQMMATYGNKEALVYNRQFDISSRKIRSSFNMAKTYNNYLFKIAIVGIESSGKSTLVRKIDDIIEEVEVVEEYGRIYCEATTNIKEHINHEDYLLPQDLVNIAIGHNRMFISAYRKALHQNKKVIVADTEHVVTKRFLSYYDNCQEEMELLNHMCHNQYYDLVVYLEPLDLHLDGTRLAYNKKERNEQNLRLKEMVKKYHSNIIYLSDDKLEDRIGILKEIINKYIKEL